MKEYEVWLEENYEELICKAAETGSDREYDFDWDQFAEREYEYYISRFMDKSD
jgi:hypothetical protein